MIITEGALPGVRILTPKRHGDLRGYFSESWNRKTLADRGIDIDFIQDNESLSEHRSTLRGLHYQAPPFAQSKLFRVVIGAVLDVCVDVRRGSASYGQWMSLPLSAKDGRQILVPRGFLHGFITTMPGTIVQYKVDNPYDAASEGSIAWDDKILGINWQLEGAQVHLSDKDQGGHGFADWHSPFEMEG